MQVPSSQVIECYTPKKFLVSCHSSHQIVLESSTWARELTRTFGHPVDHRKDRYHWWWSFRSSSKIVIWTHLWDEHERATFCGRERKVVLTHAHDGKDTQTPFLQNWGSMQNDKSVVAAVGRRSSGDGPRDFSASNKKNESSSKSSFTTPNGTATGFRCKPSSPFQQPPLPTIVLVDEAKDMDVVGETVHITFTMTTGSRR